MDRGARDRQGRASGIWPLTRCGQRGDLVGDETGDGDTGGCGRGRRFRGGGRGPARALAAADWEALPAGTRLSVWWAGNDEYFECTILDWHVVVGEDGSLEVETDMLVLGCATGLRLFGSAAPPRAALSHSYSTLDHAMPYQAKPSQARPDQTRPDQD